MFQTAAAARPRAAVAASGHRDDRALHEPRFARSRSRLAQVVSPMRRVPGLGPTREVEAVFVSCTLVRLLDAVCGIEAECGLPVTSSNHALAWHCLRLAGIDEKRPDLGRLFAV